MAGKPASPPRSTFRPTKLTRADCTPGHAQLGKRPFLGFRGGTQAEYDTFWGAGYNQESLAKLSELWKTDPLETKARAGRLILEGKMPPVAPGGHR